MANNYLDYIFIYYKTYLFPQQSSCAQRALTVVGNIQIP